MTLRIYGFDHGISIDDVTQAITIGVGPLTIGTKALTLTDSLTVEGGNAGVLHFDAAATLTIPAAGTAALLNQANSFTLKNPLTTIAESWIGPSETAGVYFKAANVGIGTTAPRVNLDINTANVANYVYAGTAGFGSAATSAQSSPKNWANFGSDHNGGLLIGNNLYIKNHAIYVANTHSAIAGSAIQLAGNGSSLGTDSIVFWTTPSGAVTADAAYAQTAPRMIINATGNVGIGTTTPVTLTEIQGGLTTTGAVLTLSSKEPHTVVNDVLGRINFRAALDTAGSDAILTSASIAAVAEGTFYASVNTTSLVFQTGASEAATTKMTLTSGGTLTVTGWIKSTGRRRAVVTKTGDYTVTVNDEVVRFTTSSTCTMLAATATGQEYEVIADGCTVVVDGAGSETINGELTQTLTDGDAIILIDTAAGKWNIG
jgi:hypothetical protein